MKSCGRKRGCPKCSFTLSVTPELKLNHGDLKATQGDTGHAQIDMITSVYAHILDEDRKVNAQKFESAFYTKPDLRSVRSPEEEKEPAPATLDLRPWYNSFASRRNWQILWRCCSRQHPAANESEKSN